MSSFQKWKWFRSADFFVLTAILCALGAGALAFGTFVLYAFRANLALNTLIVSALLFGSVLIYQQCYFLYRERFAIRWWFEYLKEHFTLAVDRPTFMQYCVVNDMITRVERVNNMGGETLSTDMIEKEAERIGHRIERNQELCRFMVGLMVALGLLGTFVGLLETLVQVSQLVGTIGEGISSSSNAEISMSNVILGLKNPMAAMGTAFSASMFGLIGSIALGLQMVRLGKATSRTHTDVRTYSLKALELVSRNQPKQRSLEDTLKQYLAELAEQGRQISTSFGLVAMLSETALPKLGDMNLHIRDTALHSVNFVEALNHATSSLRDFGGVPDKLQEMAVATRDASAHAANNHRALDSLIQGQHHIAAALGEMHVSLKEGFSRMADASQAIAASIDASERTSAEFHAQWLALQQRTIALQEEAIANAHSDHMDQRDGQVELLEALQAMSAELRMRAETQHNTLESVATAQAHILEYVAGFQSNVSGVPSLARELRTVIAELPRRDEALASFSTAVERLINLRTNG